MSIINKLKVIATIIIGIILIVTVVLKITIKKSNVICERKSNISQNNVNEEIINMDDNYVDIIRTTAEKNSDWSKLPLSKEFRKKYKSKYGILGKNDNYTELYGSYRLSDKENSIATLVIFHNLKKENYYIHYTLNNKNELDDIEIVDKKLLYDENGNEIIYKINVDNDGLARLSVPTHLEYNPLEYYNVTDNYMSKWANGFIKCYDDIGIGTIYEISDVKRQIVYLDTRHNEYDENGELLKRVKVYYKVKYYTDFNGWLDDVEVEEVSKDEIDKLLSEVKDEQ